MNNLEQAITVLQQGGIIIYPTDTAFGIGCRIDDDAAVRKLFTIRKRPHNNPTPVLFDSADLVRKYVKEIPENAQVLMDKHWPGALTLVLAAKMGRVNSLIRGGGLSVGCRIPNHEVPLSLIKELGIPIIGTSANFAGLPTPYRLADLDPKLMSLVDLVVPGVTSGQKESTVIDCTHNPFEIVRQGAIRLVIND